MITCDEGQWWVACDGCSDSHDLDVETFQEAVDMVREMGWRISRQAETWMHWCKECG